MSMTVNLVRLLLRHMLYSSSHPMASATGWLFEMAHGYMVEMTTSWSPSSIMATGVLSAKVMVEAASTAPNSGTPKMWRFFP